MRSITFDALLAFGARRKFKRSNTEVKIVDGKPEMYLFGNKIAWLGDNNRLHWTMAGYNTVTTRERINAILQRGRVWRRNYTPYYFGDGMEKEIEINPNKIYVEDWR